MSEDSSKKHAPTPRQDSKANVSGAKPPAGKHGAHAKREASASEQVYYIPSASYGEGGSHSVRDYSRSDARYRSGRKRRRSNKAGAIIALVAVLAIIGSAAYLWINRPVDITLNGSKVEARRGASLASLIEDNHVDLTPGNFVSVNGNVLEEGKGQAFSATVNGQALDDNQAKSYGVAENDSIELGNGADVTENYSATTAETSPKLLMQGGYGAVAYVSQWGRTGVTETRTGSVSGETCDVVTQETQDCIIQLHNVTPDNNQKLVALTFDDGPSEYTQRYLDILSQYGAKATFFNLGQNVREYPDLSKAIVDSGNQIACHSDSHPELPKLDEATLQSELSNSFASIKDATGVTTTTLRPPYGEFRESTWLKSNGLLSASVIWNLDSEDWKRPGADKIVSNSTAGVAPGSIILMHDGGGNRDQDVEALPRIISTLQQQGYTFVTLEELLKSDSSIPAEIASGSATMPEGSVWPTELGDA